MSLSMRGHIDNVFESAPATHVGKSGSYVNGIWAVTTSSPVSFKVTIQPLNDRELDFLQRGGQRILDPRKIYVNDGDLESIALDGEWFFFGQRWKVIKTDVRPRRNYCKVVVDRYDQQ